LADRLPLQIEACVKARGREGLPPWGGDGDRVEINVYYSLIADGG